MITDNTIKDVTFRIYYNTGHSFGDMEIDIPLCYSHLQQVNPSDEIKEKIIKQCKRKCKYKIISISVANSEFDYSFIEGLINEWDEVIDPYGNYLEWYIEHNEIYNN